LRWKNPTISLRCLSQYLLKCIYFWNHREQSLSYLCISDVFIGRVVRVIPFFHVVTCRAWSICRQSGSWGRPITDFGLWSTFRDDRRVGYIIDFGSWGECHNNWGVGVLQNFGWGGLGRRSLWIHWALPLTGPMDLIPVVCCWARLIWISAHSTGRDNFPKYTN
jgi:hypothetical protein